MPGINTSSVLQPGRSLVQVPAFSDDPGIGVKTGASIGFQLGLQYDILRWRTCKTSLYAAWAHYLPTFEFYQNAYSVRTRNVGFLLGYHLYGNSKFRTYYFR